MKELLKRAAVSVMAVLLMAGCLTTQNIIRTTSASVEGMIKGYSIYVVVHDIPDEEQAPVWEAYDRYLAAEDAAIDAYAAFTVTGNEDKWEVAKEALRQANIALLLLFPPEVQPVEN